VIIDEAKMFGEKFSLQMRLYGTVLIMFKIKFYGEKGVWIFESETKKEI